MARRVVVIEDCVSEQLLICRALSRTKQDPDVTVLSGGEEGIEYLRHTSEPPRLILVDVNMPKVNGIDVIKAAKAFPNLVGVPFIAMSTSNGQAYVREAYRAGASGYFHKSGDVLAYNAELKSLMDYWLEINITPWCKEVV